MGNKFNKSALSGVDLSKNQLSAEEVARLKTVLQNVFDVSKGGASATAPSPTVAGSADSMYEGTYIQNRILPRFVTKSDRTGAVQPASAKDEELFLYCISTLRYSKSHSEKCKVLFGAYQQKQSRSNLMSREGLEMLLIDAMAATVTHNNANAPSLDTLDAWLEDTRQLASGMTLALIRHFGSNSPTPSPNPYSITGASSSTPPVAEQLTMEQFCAVCNSDATIYQFVGQLGNIGQG